MKKRRDGGTVRAAEPSPHTPAQSGRNPRVLLLFAGLFIAARLLVAAVSWGTNDAYTFYRFAKLVDQHGLIESYRQDRELNHPPIPVIWTWAAYRIAGGHRLADASAPAIVPTTTATDGIIAVPAPTAAAGFTFVFKLPVILADGVTVYLLWLIWLPRAGPRVAAGVAAAWASSPCSILITAHHCNTDPVYAMLALLSAYLLGRRHLPLLAGLALGAAINVKLVPVLLIPPLLLSCRSWRDAARFVAGLAICVLPFVPLILQLGPRFQQNVLAYKSNLDQWGFSFLMMLAMLRPGETIPVTGPRAPANHPIVVYFTAARYLILALVGVWSLVGWRWRGRWNAYELAAVTLAIFLVFTAGFGVQYLIILLPLMFAARRGFAAVSGAVSGAFLAVAYYLTWDGGKPIYSYFEGPIPMPAAVIGLIAWGTLATFILRVLARPEYPSRAE